MDAVLRRSIGCLLACSMLLAIGCNTLESKPQQPPAVQVVVPAPSFLPPDRAIDKWDRCEKVSHYNADNLYLTLGPDAPRYRDYELQELVETQYRVGLEGVERLNVRVFRMKDPVRAFGIYSVDRSKDATPVELGARACATDLTVDACKGLYYVQLALDKPVPDSRDSLVRFAGYIVGKLPGDNSLPQMLSAFPAKDRVPNGEEFLAPGYTERPYLKGGFRVAYETGGKKYSMFLTNAGTPDDALWTWSLFRRSFENTGSAEAVLPGPWVRAFWGLDPELGRALVFQKGTFLGGTMGLADPKLADELAKQLANSIP
jgi:hypothetical protein